MSTEMDEMKAESDFCNICLRTKAEVKLNPISTKMYKMFFVEIVKCKKSKEDSRSMCVWCRRRVVNALKLVETAQTTDRILSNITHKDKLHGKTFKQIVCDQIQANKKIHSLTTKISQVISLNLPPDTGIGLPVKLEPEDGIFSEEGNVCLDGALDHKDSISLGRCDFLDSTADLTSTLFDIYDPLLEPKKESEDPTFYFTQSEMADRPAVPQHVSDIMSENLVGKRKKPQSYAAKKKKIEETDVNKTLHIEIVKLEPVSADGDQNSVTELENENSGCIFEELVSNSKSQDHENHVGAEDSGKNSQTAYSSADALKHIQLLQLTEAQRLQELDERRQEVRYSNALFKCEPCALGFSFRSSYDAHMERHSESFGSHKCLICGVYVKKIKSYQQHCRNHYERYACTLCKFNSSRRHEAIVHYMSQHTNQRHKCEHCTSEFRKISVLKLHMKTVHNAERPLFPCPRCSQVLNSKFSYNVHIGQHNHSTPHPYRCEVCSRTFRIVSHLRKHQMMHSKEKKYFCQRCGDRFKSPWTLHAHTKRKHSDICFECDYCQKTFNVKGDLKEHITWTHLGRGYNCQFCTKVLRFRFLLKRHVERKHKKLSGS